MQSTVNSALFDAFAKLNISHTAAERVVHQLWRTAAASVPIKVPVITTVNIEKLNRQQAQKLASINCDVKSFMEYANSLTSAYFKSMSLAEHMEMFVHPPKLVVATAVQEDDEDEDLVEIRYRLRTYDVGVKTHRVYELRGGVHVFVGMLGMNEFEKMIMPTE